MSFSEELKAFIEQRSPNGEDLSAAANYITTLASTGKTPLGLNRWQRSDKPVMDDFNEDNRIIDDNLSRLWADKADKTNGLSWHKAVLVEPFFDSHDGLHYSRDAAGVVHINGTFRSPEKPEAQQVIFVLPDGFRPTISLCIPCLSHTGSGGAGWITYCWISKSTGEVYFTVAAKPDNFVPNNHLCLDVRFQAA